MVRETRHLWVGNLPDNIREDRIREHFKRYGRVQSVKLLPRCTEEKTGEITMACTVAFMDIKSASKAHNAELKIDDRTLNTEYYEPAAIPSSTTSASIGSVGGVNVIGTTSSTTSSPSHNTPSPYSTSPAGSRFPNGHGSAADDHATFTASSSDRFGYDRSTSRNSSSAVLSSSAAPVDVGVGSDFRRGGGGYHESAVAGATSRLTARNRGDRDRDRDRPYRSTNGPSSTYLDSVGANRSVRTTATGGGVPGGSVAPSSAVTAPSWSSYETTTRYNSTGSSQADTGYSTTPSENDRRTTDQSSKKKIATKSRSGSRSVSPSGSTSSRSPSRSRSRSSSSSSSSSTSRATSSTGSPKSRRVTSSSNVNSNHQPVVHSDDRRPLAICVRNLPLRSSDTSLKDGLFHEYKKHGKVTWVKVVGQNSERHAIVCFKKPEDVEKALEVSYDKLFFGCKIEVAPYQGYEVEDNDCRPYEAEIDEYHQRATRTLFIGNLEKDVTASDLRKHFDQFGEIIEIDIKKQGAVSSYAFCQYSDIVSVVKAIRKMDGEHLGNNRIKLGFGKSMPYNCVWVDGINENVNEKYLRMHFDTFGVINKVHIDRDKGQALIFYEQVSSSQAAVTKMRGFVLKNSKLQVDYASRECQESFFERMEKQGNTLERSTVFDERRELSSRSFESSSIGRFSRYDVPTRPRTSSYSSRSSLSAVAVVSSSIQSPGGATPGSVTPRGTTGSRSTRSRFVTDYYEQGIDYPSDRHFRNYDEYSQGSAASHDDVIYELVGPFVHEGPINLDVLDTRSMPSQLVDPVPFAPADIRNLQKERVHLLEQLEDCPSSSDELMSPKKRLKLDLLDSGADVIIEANRDHRKVMEVRRLSDTNLKHHSRRPSIDATSKHSNRDLRHDISYMPHAVCKRRKTASSDSGSKVHHYDHSGSESVGGSRPGTPLCDERPENLQPTEPRRVVGRDREGPLTLPLPRFAAQVMNRGSVSVAGIKGQKDNVLSSPPAVTSPRISNPRPPSPVHVPPPASPPPRPPSISSNSSDSDITPPSPSLEERIRSLDEKYEKWSGSRTLTTPATGDAMFLEKFRQRHKLLDLDLKEVQPSEIVKSVMAKRSVFDEDLKRLENVGEKYEPKEFPLFPRVGSCTTLTNQQQQQQQQSSVPATPLSAPPTLKLAPITQLPKTPSLLSPRSAGTALPAVKGLQYPFPTHQPVLMSPIPPVPVIPQPQTPSTTTAAAAAAVSSTSGALLIATTSIANATTVSMTALTTSPSAIITPSTTSTRGNAPCHGDNRLKPCASVSSETTRTTSKVTVNRSNIVSSNKMPDKTIGSGDQVSSSSEKSVNKSVRETKSSDKTSEKILTRRDSNSNSPRADVKTRRNSDTSARRIEDNETTSNKEKEQNEERKKERLEKVRLENEKLEKEKQEKERIERERLEKEKQDKERLEREKIEKDRLERESELEKQRLEKERLEKEREEKIRLEKEQAERERLQKEKEEKEKRQKEERERKERERKEREERERKEREERERKEREEREKLQLEKEMREKEEREREEREKKEKEEKERREREERERKEKEEKERREREEKERKLEEERAEKERHEKEKQLERERKREEERARHKEDNHDKRNDHKHREINSETKHKDSSSIEKHVHDSKNTKDDKFSIQHEENRRDSHSSSHEKSKHHIEREERRKDSIKENRDNNVHDKQKGIESRHLSIDLDKNKTLSDSNKRKERNNSVPANIGSKRRMSSHELSSDHQEPDTKKIKLGHEHKKVSERRDSRDSTRSEDRSKSSSKHKNNSTKSHEKHNSSRECDEKRKEKEREERHKKHKLEKQKSKSKSREKESQENPPLPKSPVSDKDFLARLELRSAEDMEKQKKDKEVMRQKSRELSTDEKEPKILEIKKEKQLEKQPTQEKPIKSRSDNDSSNKSSEEKKPKRERLRKITNSSDSDSDEPKKHSIFDIVDDEPAYISMYDKVKARSCKNMAKQEEEKRQEKIKAKFSQLKQSRAKREEKKRSTSWDEDSDSERDPSEVKMKRCPKMLIDSSDDENQDRKSRKKKEYSDSDSSAILRQVKQEPIDTSEDEIKNKHLVKSSSNKMRTEGDRSEDEHIKTKLLSKNEIKTEMVSDENTEDVDDKSQLTKVKEETLLNKERRNSKHLETPTESQIYNEITEIKQEKVGNRHNFMDNTSDEETHEINKKERREKKHKKKQKKQKHSISSEDVSKLEGLDQTQIETVEKSKHHEKKKEHSKKEKRRDKTKEGREKSKKSKKNKSENKSEIKKEGKMENIFGSLSDDSETCTKDVEQQEQKIQSFVSEEPAVPVYASENEKEPNNEPKIKEKSEREKDREEHKRKKEKKRREKERRLQEAAAAAAAAAATSVAAEQTSNENSMDFADMGKQLEENMLRDDSMEATEQASKDNEEPNFENAEDPFKFIDVPEMSKSKDKEERREVKEKKKKRKKSKEEKSKHHHHHHHEKSKSKSESKKEQILPPAAEEEVKEEVDQQQKPQDPSLPSLLEEPTIPEKSPVEKDPPIVPATEESASDVQSPEAATPKETNNLLPTFIDEKLHESAVQSISQFEEKTPVVAKEEEEVKSDGGTEFAEEKPRVVISQEETEDAVAALLGESFGSSGQFEECYEEDINETIDQSSTLAEETLNPQDDEEMRQAVQSLSTGDLDVKPDTPQSETELQIDTDTEEQDEVPPPRYDAPPKTPDIDLSRPKTPQVYFQNTPDSKISTPATPATPATPTPLVIKAPSSPPSLTPIKPLSSAAIAEVTKVLDMEPKSLPLLPDNTRSVISQSWTEKKQEAVVVTKEPEPKLVPTVTEAQPKIVTASPVRVLTTPSVLKISEPTVYPPLQPISKPEATSLPQTTEQSKVPPLQTVSSPNISQMHNLPARPPVQNSSKTQTSIHDTVVQQKLPMMHNRLPITSVMVSKPLQPTTVILQQSKIAHPLEPPKLVSTSDPRPQERPRMVFQTATIQSPQFQPRMMVQGNIRHLTPQGLLVPTRQLNPHSFGYLGNMPHSTYNISPIIKDNLPSGDKKPAPTESQVKVSQPGLITTQNCPVPKTPTVLGIAPPLSLTQPLSLPKVQSPKPPTPALHSPKPQTPAPVQNLNPQSPKLSLQTSPVPKPSNSPMLSPVQKLVLPSSPTPAIPHSVITQPSGTSPASSPNPKPLPVSLSAEPQSIIVKTSKPSEEEATSSTDTIKEAPKQEKPSIPSTVIISTVKEEPAKEEVKKPVEPEEPIKLAIEKVTEELNMSLDKEIRENIENKPEPMEEKSETPEEESKPTIASLLSEEKPSEEPAETKTSSTEDKNEESKETISANKEIEKFEEEKADTESIISDISKERLSADILAKDDPLDTKEDSDYWSAKEVNIDSVIKTLCSGDELSDHSSDNGKDDWDNSNKNVNLFIPDLVEKEQLPLEKKEEVIVNESKSDDSEVLQEDVTEIEEQQKEVTSIRTPARGRGTRGRGRGKTRGTVERGGIQTRRGKLATTVITSPALPATPNKRGRITRAKPERKTSKSESEGTPADIYEFRDETDDSSKEQRPRLILTIKSPAISNSNNAQTTAIIKEVTKDGAKEIVKEVVHSAVIKTTLETKEFASPATTNKRKSKRLQEKDIRNTVDDTIEDVVKNNVITRAAANQRRTTRQSTPKVPATTPQLPETPRKSPRGRKTRRGSEATETSSSEETSRDETAKSMQSPIKEVEKVKEPEEEIKVPEAPKEKPLEGLKAAFLKRIKREQAAVAAATTAPPPAQREPTNLIDPVTGEIIPMRECEEGKYIPLPGTKPIEAKPEETATVKEVRRTVPETKPIEMKPQPTVIAQPQPITIVQQSKPQTLKAHVLSSQAAQAAQLSTVTHVQPPPVQAKITVQPTQIVTVKNPPIGVIPPTSIPTRTLMAPVSVAKSIAPVAITKTVTPIVATKVASPVVSKPVTPISQHLSVNTSLGMGVESAMHLSPRPNMHLATKQIVKPPVLSPVLALNQQKQMLQTSKQQPMIKTNLTTTIMSTQPQIVNNQLAHIKHQQVLKQQVGIGEGPMVKQTHHLHPQQILTAAVPSPPLSKSSPLSNNPRIIQGPTPVVPKGIMEPPKVDVSMANVMLGQRPKLSPQGPHQRLVGQAGMPVPGYEASLHGERSLLNRSRSPPPAHQNSPSPKGEAITHFPPLRPPPDMIPSHYITPSRVEQFQQYMKLQMHLNRARDAKKVVDGQEGEEAPVTSPPLELRRTGSVGMALAGRGAAVPHSLHSPHDRATDSPQVGQVYNVLSDRVPPYYTANRYFDHAEPPPAHQQNNSHAPLAALGSDRGRAAHITSMGTPDRPLSGGHPALSAHMGTLASTPERSALGALGPPDRAKLGGLSTPDRPLSSHIERPLSSSSTLGMMGAGLGAAGNLMGAVARHIGADTPTSQRGLQAATPPHASQVPPQAESLFIMLMKQYPCMWQGLLALKNDQAAVQMYFVSGNDDVAKCCLPKNTDGSTPPLRIFQRMRLEPPQVEGVARKMQMENEHCMLLALPCGHDHMDVLKQSTNLTNGFITYLQQKQAAGIVNVAAPGTTQPPAYVVHIFPSCDFVNENLRRIAPSLLERVADIAHLLIVITTV